ncbi:MAG: sugar phosphate nucleotidyltransferase [Candidatus Nitrosocaldus sp.]
MQAVILAGGKGTRLQPYTTILPKPLMPVGDYPILEIIMRQLKKAGVKEIILAVGYMHQLFQAFFNDGKRYGLKIIYSFEEKELGTAGPISLILDILDKDFIVMNGDILTTLNYSDLFNFHHQKNSAATIALSTREVNIDFGVIETNSDDKLIHYIEKPTYKFNVSMGINVMNKESIAPYLKIGEYRDIPDLMKRLIEDNKPVYCYRSDCYWLDIGRIEDYKIATEIFNTKKTEFLPS